MEESFATVLNSMHGFNSASRRRRKEKKRDILDRAKDIFMNVYTLLRRGEDARKVSCMNGETKKGSDWKTKSATRREHLQGRSHSIG